MNLSERVLSLSPSVTLAITAKAKEMRANGIDVVSLSAGEPDFDTPEVIKQAAASALQDGRTRYTPAIGTLELREAVCQKLARDQGLQFTPDRIIVGVGAKHSIFNVLFALLNAGDEVLIPVPYWLSYPEMVTVLGGKNVFVETTQKSEFKLTADQLESSITPQTKALILNSPSNPTGAVYTKDELLALVAVLKKHPNVVVISDEIYEKLIFDGKEHVSIASLDSEIAARTVIVNGMSKAYAMTGWRLGYAACPNPELAKAIASLQSHSTSNPTSFAQDGGVVALQKGDEETAKMLAVFQKRRDWFIDQLKALPRVNPFCPQGAFYAFVDIRETGMGSLELCQALIEEAQLAVVPGKPFGNDGYVRMSFATSDENLQKAVDRLSQWLSTAIAK